ncbi:RidA family protein [Streptomyces sp. UNOC14_S4]|uniref:RidA family protein n=1 Tax=Streptomyces sp. UNOC14_S4 TaxID=2872340 RepID=UPI001E4782F7|nr:RidA family protein [Streptomyces sp. UNOC14_S4]MCC3767383.1 RidA family protein [Streptomyces sp. UNOC14_S4]
MTAERINPPALAPPRGFSHAVLATGTRYVLLSGQTALDANGRITAPDLPAQFERALTNLLQALEAAGGTAADLARLTVYTTDLRAYRACARDLGAVWRGAMGRDYPAMTVVEVNRLWDEEALVELEGTAVLG